MEKDLLSTQISTKIKNVPEKNHNNILKKRSTEKSTLIKNLGFTPPLNVCKQIYVSVCVFHTRQIKKKSFSNILISIYYKNPPYGRHRLSRRVWIVEPIL